MAGVGLVWGQKVCLNLYSYCGQDLIEQFGNHYQNLT